MKHIVAFFVGETLMSAIRYDECCDFRNTFALLSPNFARKLSEAVSIQQLVANRSEFDPVLAWATHTKYLSPLNRFMAWCFKADYIRVGFLDWVDRRRQDAPMATLFPEVTQDKYGAESSIFSRRFSSDLKHLNLGDRRLKLTFHSFRYTFKQALDRADIPERHMDELCGWARGKSIGRRYGTGLEADVLRPSLKQVGYGIRLDDLLSHALFAD